MERPPSVATDLMAKELESCTLPDDLNDVNYTPRLFICLLVAASAVLTAAVHAASVTFPPGIDWTNATPEQIRQAVFNAVKADPDAAVDIVTSSIESVAQTGRFPRAGETDGKQVLDPNVDTFEEVSDQIGDAATEANPSMATQIAQAVNNAVGTTMVTDTSSGGGGGGGGGGGAPPLPGGFGGGGGGGGNGGDGDGGTTPSSGGGPVYGS